MKNIYKFHNQKTGVKTFISAPNINKAKHLYKQFNNDELIIYDEKITKIPQEDWDEYCVLDISKFCDDVENLPEEKQDLYDESGYYIQETFRQWMERNNTFDIIAMSDAE